MEGDQEEVDGLDAEERDDHAAQAVEKEVPPKDAAGAEGTVLHAAESERE